MGGRRTTRSPVVAAGGYATAARRGAATGPRSRLWQRPARSAREGAAAADELAPYNLEGYDDDDGVKVHGAGMGEGLHGLTSVPAAAAAASPPPRPTAGHRYHASNADDPFITLRDSDDEADDFRVKPTDNLVVVGQTEDVYSHLEVSV